jgi:hypothetical protein
MDKASMAKIAAYLKSAFPGAFKDMHRVEVEMFVATWQDILSRFSEGVVTSAVKRFIRESGSAWCPSVSQVYQLCVEIEDEEQERRYLAAQREGNDD